MAQPRGGVQRLRQRARAARLAPCPAMP